ncbi:hypothetical protein CHS0354_026191 [Potamilus streckersoni]|uniref:Uncharacterized protein n=1 Tax=Potamilus streckersoni TaxID=2493646 RepID=A0AAE0SM01_9BIVA|nr:hypothetical protein CHS0354_026191 [Potamilus streckersoni]
METINSTRHSDSASNFIQKENMFSTPWMHVKRRKRHRSLSGMRWSFYRFSMLSKTIDFYTKSTDVSLINLDLVINLEDHFFFRRLGLLLCSFIAAFTLTFIP